MSRHAGTGYLRLPGLVSAWRPARQWLIHARSALRALRLAAEPRQPPPLPVSVRRPALCSPVRPPLRREAAAGAAMMDAGAAGRGAAAGGRAFSDVVAGSGLTVGATMIRSGAFLYEFPAGDGLAVRTGVAPAAGRVRGSGNGRGSGTASGGFTMTG